VARQCRESRAPAIRRPLSLPAIAGRRQDVQRQASAAFSPGACGRPFAGWIERINVAWMSGATLSRFHPLHRARKAEGKSFQATILQAQIRHRWDRGLGVAVPQSWQTWLGRVVPVGNSAVLAAVLGPARYASALRFRGATKAQVALIPVVWSNLRWKVQ